MQGVSLRVAVDTMKPKPTIYLNVYCLFDVRLNWIDINEYPYSHCDRFLINTHHPDTNIIQIVSWRRNEGETSLSRCGADREIVILEGTLNTS